MEKITQIDDIASDSECGPVGVQVTTTDQSIRMTIVGGQRCCENSGYFVSNDDPDEFVGATLLEVKLTDTALNQAKLTAALGGDLYKELYEGKIMFVDLITDRGVLQFVAYNQHNGYYGHDAKVECKQLKHETTL